MWHYALPKNQSPEETIPLAASIVTVVPLFSIAVAFSAPTITGISSERPTTAAWLSAPPFQYDEVIRVVSEKAAETGSRLIIPDSEELKLIKADLNGTEFLYKGKRFTVGM